MQLKRLFSLLTAFLTIASIFGMLGSTQTLAKTKSNECISKTMPWEDASKCISSSSSGAVLGGSTGGKPASLNPDILFNLINARRAELGLPAYQKDDRICKIAQDRGPELYNEIFVTGNMHAGFKARNLPYWATENMISLGSEQASFNWWMNSSIHRRAIENPNYTHSCGACWGNSCAQIFTAFQPK